MSEGSISHWFGGKGESLVVFLHGWLGEKEFWRKSFDNLKSRYRVLALDLPGHGESTVELPVWDFETARAELGKFLQNFSPPYLFVGHSLGGALALDLARDFAKETRGVVGVETWFYERIYPKVSGAKIEEFLKPFREDFPSALEDFFRGMFFADADPDVVKIVSKAAQQVPAPVALSWFEALLRWDLMKALDASSVPRVCVAGDWLSEKKEQVWRTHFPIVRLAGTGHFPMLEKPKEFTKALEKILKANFPKGKSR